MRIRNGSGMESTYVRTYERTEKVVPTVDIFPDVTRARAYDDLEVWMADEDQDQPRNCILSGDKPHPLQPTEIQTCQRCVGHTRADLYAVADAYRLLPSLLGQLGSNAPRDNGASLLEHGLPGGDALVMLAGGSPAMARLRAYLRDPDDPAGLAERLRYGFVRPDSDLDQDDQTNDSESIAYELGRWEDDWRLARGEPAATSPMSVVGAFEYLRGFRLTWAAQWHHAFDEFATDLKRMRRQLEIATGTDDAPKVADVRCFDCEGGAERKKTLERHYRHDGLEDEWTCRICKRRYDQASYYLAVRAHLELTIWRSA